VFPILLDPIITLFVPSGRSAPTDDEVPWLVVLVFGFMAHTVHVFTAALTCEALKALRGEPPSIANGMTTASQRAAAIVSFAAVTSTIGFLLAVMGRSSRVALQIARTLIGTAWSLATYLAIPVMVQERRGGVTSLRRSGMLFRRTWGETALSEVGVRVLTVHLTLLLVVISLVLIEVLGESLLTLLIVMTLVAAVFGVVGCLEAIYRAALYVFASEGVVPAPFGGPELDAIWQVKSDPEPPTGA
jgi:hypothetical protein